MKNGRFETQAEVYEFLFAKPGINKVGTHSNKIYYLVIREGFLVDSVGRSIHQIACDISELEVYQEPAAQDFGNQQEVWQYLFEKPGAHKVCMQSKDGWCMAKDGRIVGPDLERSYHTFQDYRRWHKLEPQPLTFLEAIETPGRYQNTDDDLCTIVVDKSISGMYVKFLFGNSEQMSIKSNHITTDTYTLIEAEIK